MNSRKKKKSKKNRSTPPPSRLHTLTCARVSEGKQDVFRCAHLLDSLWVVNIRCWWPWPDEHLGVDLIVEPVVVVCVPRQSCYNASPFARIGSGYSLAGLRATLISIYHTFPPCVRVEGVECPQPRSNIIRPPQWNADSILDLGADDFFLVAGHASGGELFKEWAVMFKGWVQERKVSAAVVQLGRFVILSARK